MLTKCHSTTTTTKKLEDWIFSHDVVCWAAECLVVRLFFLFKMNGVSLTHPKWGSWSTTLLEVTGGLRLRQVLKWVRRGERAQAAESSISTKRPNKSSKACRSRIRVYSHSRRCNQPLTKPWHWFHCLPRQMNANSDSLWSFPIVFNLLEWSLDTWCGLCCTTVFRE